MYFVTAVRKAAPTGGGDVIVTALLFTELVSSEDALALSAVGQHIEGIIQENRSSPHTESVDSFIWDFQTSRTLSNLFLLCVNCPDSDVFV